MSIRRFGGRSVLGYPVRDCTVLVCTVLDCTVPPTPGGRAGRSCTAQHLLWADERGECCKPSCLKELFAGIAECRIHLRDSRPEFMSTGRPPPGCGRRSVASV